MYVSIASYVGKVALEGMSTQRLGLLKDVIHRHNLVKASTNVNISGASELFQVKTKNHGVFNLGDHMYLFKDDKGRRVIITHPYASSVPPSNPKYGLGIQGVSTSFGMDVYEYKASESFYNPGETTMFVFVIVDEKLFRKKAKEAKNKALGISVRKHCPYN